MSPIHSHSFTLSVGLYLSISLRLALFHSSLVEIDGLWIGSCPCAGSGLRLVEEFGLSPWPSNPGRFKFRANKGSINIGVGLQGGAKMSDYLVLFQINYFGVALNNTCKS